MSGTWLVVTFVLVATFWKACADCPQPPMGDAFIAITTPVDPDVPVQNRDKFRYVCTMEGYRIAGQPNNRKTGSTIRCLGMTYNKPRPCCEKIHCKAPDDGVNTETPPRILDVIPGRNYTYLCLPGYETSGEVISTCQDDATWSLGPPPTCEAISCGAVMDGVNTKPVDPAQPQLSFMEFYTYECEDGYSTTDELCVFCNSRGQFSSPPPNCTKQDYCDSSPCQNNGTCVPGVVGYCCECALGFTGLQCETNINECDPNPCQNGGLCTEGAEPGTFTCECVGLFTGPTCEAVNCPSPYTAAGSACYRVMTSPLHWLSAKASCEASGDILVMAKTTSKLEEIIQLPGISGGPHWLGGGQITSGIDETYTWLDGTEVEIRTPSSFVQSSAAQEMLTVTRTFGDPTYILAERDRQASLPYICEKVEP